MAGAFGIDERQAAFGTGADFGQNAAPGENSGANQCAFGLAIRPAGHADPARACFINRAKTFRRQCPPSPRLGPNAQA